MGKRGTHAEEIPEELAQRWADLREVATAEFRSRAESDADGLDSLEKIAWFGAMGHSTEVMAIYVSEAHRMGASWRSIAVALGEPASRGSANRVRSRFNSRI